MLFIIGSEGGGPDTTDPPPSVSATGDVADSAFP